MKMCLLVSFPSLTVTDSDGATNSTQAIVVVYKAKDYRPVANAGPNQVWTPTYNNLTILCKKNYRLLIIWMWQS